MRGDWGSRAWPDLNSPPRHRSPRLTGLRKPCLGPPAAGTPSDCSPVCLWGDVSLCYVSPSSPHGPLERQVPLVQPVLQTGNLGHKSPWPWFCWLGSLPVAQGGHTQADSSWLGCSHLRGSGLGPGRMRWGRHLSSTLASRLSLIPAAQRDLPLSVSWDRLVQGHDSRHSQGNSTWISECVWVSHP